MMEAVLKININVNVSSVEVKTHHSFCGTRNCLCSGWSKSDSEKRSVRSLMQRLDRGLSDMMMGMKMNETEL